MIQIVIGVLGFIRDKIRHNKNYYSLRGSRNKIIQASNHIDDAIIALRSIHPDIEDEHAGKEKLEEMKNG